MSQGGITWNPEGKNTWCPPVISNSLSAKVLFPWSTCAMILKLRIFSTGNCCMSSASFWKAKWIQQLTNKQTLGIKLFLESGHQMHVFWWLKISKHKITYLFASIAADRNASGMQLLSEGATAEKKQDDSAPPTRRYEATMNHVTPGDTCRHKTPHFSSAFHQNNPQWERQEEGPRPRPRGLFPDPKSPASGGGVPGFGSEGRSVLMKILGKGLSKKACLYVDLCMFGLA